MAKPNSSTVTVGSPYDLTAGYVYYGLKSAVTKIPTTASESVDTTQLTLLGHITSDGIELSEDSSTTKIYAFGGVAVRTVRTEYSESVAFALMQAADADVAKFVYGPDNVTVDDDGMPQIKHTGDLMPEYVLVIDLLVAPEIKERFVFESAQLTERDTITLNGEDPSGRQVTLALNPGADGKTTTHDYFAKVATD